MISGNRTWILYISRSIIKAYGSRISADNNTDVKGAPFTFMLSIEKPHQVRLR
jgi:K+-sensing histidine kinase KdpD